MEGTHQQAGRTPFGNPTLLAGTETLMCVSLLYSSRGGVPLTRAANGLGKDEPTPFCQPSLRSRLAASWLRVEAQELSGVLPYNHTETQL